MVVIGPSNPIVSIGPILAVPGMTDLLANAKQAGTPIVAVSGIVGGRALKGPADRMLTSLGHGRPPLESPRSLPSHRRVRPRHDRRRPRVGDRRPRASNLHDRHDHERRRSEGQSRPRDARLRGIAPPARVCTIGLVTDDAGSPTPPRIAAIVPVGSLGGAKSRLGEWLDAEERQELVEGFLARTLAVVLELQAAGRLADVLVVSPDRDILAHASRAGRGRSGSARAGSIPDSSRHGTMSRPAARTLSSSFRSIFRSSLPRRSEDSPTPLSARHRVSPS